MRNGAFYSAKTWWAIPLRPLADLSINYTQSPFIRTSPIRLDPEILGKFKTRALGNSNLRTTSKNLRTASPQIFKAKNQFVDESIVDGPQKRSKRVNHTALRSGNLDD